MPWSGLTALLLAVLVVAAGVYWRAVPQPGDSWSYVEAGRNFPHSNWNAVGYSRYGLVLPLALLVRVFGFSQLTQLIVPLLSGALLAATVHLLTARRFGRFAGVVAALLVMANSVVFLTLTRVYPDLPSTAVFSLCLLLALQAGDEAHDPARSRRRLILLLLAVGLLLGLGYEIRETTVFAWPVVAWVLLRRLPLRLVLATVALPALLCLGAELLLNGLVHGDPLLRIRTLLGANTAGIADNGIPSDQAYLGRTRWEYARLIWDLAGKAQSTVWLQIAGVLALVGGLAFRRKVGIFAAWAGLALAPLLLNGGVLSPTHPSVRQDVARYWIAFIVPMVIAAAGTVVETGRLLAERLLHPRHTVRALAAVAAAAALCASPVIAWQEYATTDQTFAPNGGADVEEFRSHLGASLPAGAQLWSGGDTRRLLDFYRTPATGGAPVWNAHLHVLKPGAPGPAAGDYVVLINTAACAFCNNDTRAWVPGVTSTTRTWHRIWRSRRHEVRMYEVR